MSPVIVTRYFLLDAYNRLVFPSFLFLWSCFQKDCWCRHWERRRWRFCKGRWSIDWTTVRGSRDHEGLRSSTTTNDWHAADCCLGAVERLLCSRLYNCYRSGLHEKQTLWLSARNHFLVQHLPCALGTVPIGSWPRKRCLFQQKKELVLSSPNTQWRLYGRILAGTPWVTKRIVWSGFARVWRWKTTTMIRKKKGKSPKKYPTTVTNATVSDCHFTDYFALRTNALFVPSARDVYVGSWITQLWCSISVSNSVFFLVGRARDCVMLFSAFAQILFSYKFLDSRKSRC